VRKPIATAFAVSMLAVPGATAQSTTVLDEHLTQTGRELRQAVRTATAKQQPQVPPHLEAIAQCESGGNPRAIGGGGAYRGKYQFSRETWAAVGGTGDPAAAPEAEQDRRAAILYARSGPGQWPVCGA
jgi:hypothetical protein